MARQDKTRQDKTRQDKTRQDKTRQVKTLYILSKYMILRPGTANSVANLGWPGNRIKNKQKKLL